MKPKAGASSCVCQPVLPSHPTRSSRIRPNRAYVLQNSPVSHTPSTSHFVTSELAYRFLRGDEAMKHTHQEAMGESLFGDGSR